MIILKVKTFLHTTCEVVHRHIEDNKQDQRDH